MALLAALPLLFIIDVTIGTGWHEAWALLVRPRVGELLANTTRLTVGGIALSVVIGTGAAWLVERTTLPGARIWNVLLAAPLTVPAFVTSFGWVSITARVQSFAGALAIVTLSYYPLVYLPVAATLRGLDPALEETGRALGLGPWRAFVRVVLPQLRLALLGGGLLVGLHLLAEFGALQLLRFPTFTTAIYDQYRSSFNGPAANMLAGVLVVCCAVLLTAELAARGRRRYARVGGGAPRMTGRVRLGRLTAPMLAVVSAIVVLALGVPLGGLVYWMVVGASTAFPIGALAAGAATSIGLALAAAAVTAALALPVAWLAVRHRGRLATLLERVCYVANALPGIVVALALITLATRFVPQVYQTTPVLIAAYAMLFLPRALVSTRAAVAQAPPVLDDVALALGTRPAARLWRVTLPLIARGVGSGAALVFLAALTELTATLLLAPTGTRTLAIEFWSRVSDVDYGAAAPYAALMVVLSAPATYLLTRRYT